jgi:hypothetical protein
MHVNAQIIIRSLFDRIWILNVGTIVISRQGFGYCDLFFFFFFFVANQVQISCLISRSSELNRCGFLLLCQEQNITSKNRSDVGCTGTPFGISQFNPLRVLYYWVMRSFMIHLRFYSCGAPSTGWWLSAEFSRLTIRVFQSPEFFCLALPWRALRQDRQTPQPKGNPRVRLFSAHTIFCFSSQKGLMFSSLPARVSRLSSSQNGLMAKK